VAPASDFYSPPLPPVPPGTALLNAEVCRQSADLEKALRECKKIIRKGNLDGAPLAAYHNRCAEIELQLGQYDEAIADLTTAMREDPPNRRYESNLAIAKARAGR
jgi:tetratricopeptide (TPR) repeat protein